MDKQQFKQLQCEHGTDNVFKDDDEYIICLHDGIFNADEAEYNNLFNDCDGVKLSYEYVDDLPTYVIITKLENVTAEQFKWIEEYCGAPGC